MMLTKEFLAQHGRGEGGFLFYFFFSLKIFIEVSQVGPVVKSLPANAGDKRDVGSIPG